MQIKQICNLLFIKHCLESTLNFSSFIFTNYVFRVLFQLFKNVMCIIQINDTENKLFFINYNLKIFVLKNITCHL